MGMLASCRLRIEPPFLAYWAFSGISGVGFKIIISIKRALNLKKLSFFEVLKMLPISNDFLKWLEQKAAGAESDLQ